MLKENTFNEGDVVALRLSTTEEIIGEITKISDIGYSLKKPCTLAMQPDGSGIGLTPAVILGDPEKSVLYKHSAIIAFISPRADAERSYKEYSTGLQLAPKSGIVTPNK